MSFSESDCQLFITYLVSQLGSMYGSCSVITTLKNYTINSATIKASDCNDSNCKSLFASLTSVLQTYSIGDCKVKDISTSNLVTLSSLSSLCGLKPGTTNATTTKPSSLTPIADIYNSLLGTTATPTTTSTTSNDSLRVPPIVPSPEISKESTGISIGAIVGIAGGVGVILILALVYFWYKRRSKPYPQDQFTAVQDTQSPTKGSQNKTTTGSADLVGFSNPGGSVDMCQLDIHRVPPSEVVIIKVVAQGAHGEVCLGLLHETKVAIKRLLPSKTSLDDLQKFIWEIKLLSKLDCPYIVRFLGVTFTRPSDMMLITEFMEGGDLREVIQNNDDHRFTWDHKLRCALHVSEALVYLHSLDPKVIHRDLKSRNVLLDNEFNGKLTDFGIARETDDATMTAGIGTYRWMAPEVLLDGHYSESADIFSFGVILSEISTEILPYSDLRNGNGKPYTDTAIMAQVMVGQLKPSFSDDTPAWMRALGQACLELNPAMRPSAPQVAYQIRMNLHM